MKFIQNMDLLSVILIISIGILCLITLFFQSQKRFEIAIIMIILSPWIHFLFALNIPQSPEEVFGASNSVELPTYIRMSIVMFAGGIGAFKYLHLRSSNEERVPIYLFVFMVFLFYALLSTFYSIDRTYTFIRTVEFIAFFCFLLGLFSWLKDSSRIDNVIDIFYFIIVFGAIINIGTLAFFPDRAWWWQAPERFQGFMAHPNTLGGFCMISYPILLWKSNRQDTTSSKIFILIILFMLLSMHVLSGSRTTLAASLVGFAAWQIVLKKKIGLVMIAAAVVFSGFFLATSQFRSFNRIESTSITNLTGRTQFWLGSLELAVEKPVLGYGYAVEGKIWEDPRFQSNRSNLWMGSARSSIHNGYLSVVIGLGFIGLLMWLVITIPPVWGVFYLPGDYYKALFLVVFIQLLLTNFFESVISSSRNLESIAFWIYWIIVTKYIIFHDQGDSVT